MHYICKYHTPCTYVTLTACVGSKYVHLKHLRFFEFEISWNFKKGNGSSLFFSSVFSVWGWFRLLTTSRSHTVKQKQRNQIKFFPRTIQSTRYTILQLRHYCPLSNSPTRSKGAFTSLAAAFIVATFVLIATIFLRNVENRHLVCLRCGCPRWKCPWQDLLRREVLQLALLLLDDSTNWCVMYPRFFKAANTPVEHRSWTFILSTHFRCADV